MFPHTRRKPQLPIQPDLFEPPPNRPTWSNLPEEIQREVKNLLVEVLRQYLVRGSGGDSQEGANE
jgi:hypothetical protein